MEKFFEQQLLDRNSLKIVRDGFEGIDAFGYCHYDYINAYECCSTNIFLLINARNGNVGVNF